MCLSLKPLSTSLAEAAQALVGVPYQRQGRTTAGLDCVGLLVRAARELGVDLAQWDRVDYGRQLDPADISSRLAAALTPADSLHVGAIVQLDVPRLGPVHVGIVAERNGRQTLVHATEKTGMVSEHSLSRQFRERITQIYQLKEQ